MQEKDLALVDLSTTVRFEDFYQLLKETGLKSYGTFLNGLAIINAPLAARMALKTFSKTRFKDFKPRGIFGSRTEDYLYYEDKKIYLYKFGKATAKKKVLLCHGWEGQGSDFYKLVPQLVEAGYEVVAFDGPAHGQSWGTHSHMFEFVEVIQKICEKEGDFEVAIGHSMGGLSLALANKLSTKFNPKRLVTLGAPNKLDQVFSAFADIIGINENVYQQMIKEVERVTLLKFNDVRLENLMNSTDDIKTLLVHDYLDDQVPFKRAQEVREKCQVDLFDTYGLGHVKILRANPVIEKILHFLL